MAGHGVAALADDAGHLTSTTLEVPRHAEISAELRVICAEMTPHFGMPQICPCLIRI
jgi:hypothetical protein